MRFTSIRGIAKHPLQIPYLLTVEIEHFYKASTMTRLRSSPLLGLSARCCVLSASGDWYVKIMSIDMMKQFAPWLWVIGARGRSKHLHASERSLCQKSPRIHAGFHSGSKAIDTWWKKSEIQFSLEVCPFLFNHLLCRKSEVVCNSILVF